MKKAVYVASLAFLLTCSVSFTNTNATSPAPSAKIPESEFHTVYVKDNLATPSPSLLIQKKSSTSRPKISLTGIKWVFDRNVSWYGPGFYGHRTACGYAYTKTILGVAHKTLPCGTKVAFKYGNITIVVPVIDRGPYVTGRQWDLSGGLCTYLHHCFTGPIYFKVLR